MNYFHLLPRVAAKLRQNPKFFGEIMAYAGNDLSSLLGRYRYPTRTIFIAGLPKSGTTWVETQLAAVPGYNIRPVVEHGGVVTDHDINDRVFTDLPSYGYSVVKLHTRWSEQNMAIINRHVDRFMIMIRDLRDMTVSAYFHVKQEATHRDHAYYNACSEEEGLLHRIGVTAAHYVSWVGDWLSVAASEPRRILVVRYEDLNELPDVGFQRIFGFFGLPVEAQLLRSLLASKISEAQDFDRVRNESVGLRMKSTARKGVVGGWRNHFTEVHKSAFKEQCGDILVASGYEQDDRW